MKKLNYFIGYFNLKVKEIERKLRVNGAYNCLI